MVNSVFSDITFRKEFESFKSDPYLRAMTYLSGKDPDFRSAYTSNEAANIIKYKELCTISVMMKKDGFSKFMPIKGMMLLNTLLFDFFGIRQMADIDILVHPAEFGKIPKFVENHPELKVKSNFSTNLRRCFGEDISFSLNSTLIELHSKITLVSFPGLIEEIFEKSEMKKNPDGLEFLVPELPYAAILMLLHDYSRDDFIDLTFKRLIEFYTVISNCELKKLKNIAEKHGLSTMLDSHLFLIWTMIENTFYDRYDFKIIEEFGHIKKHEKFNSFKVTKPMKLQKALYGKRWKHLKLRNILASVFKKLAGNRK